MADEKKAKERPILFSGAMIRAILKGKKTQTRRIVKPNPDWTEPATGWCNGDGHSGTGWYAYNEDYPEEGSLYYRCPYGEPGDLLWVKETTLKVEDHGYIGPVYAESDDGRACLAWGLAPSADDCTEVEPWDIKRRPSIFMSRSMARILLEVVSIRVERLNDISDADAVSEGSLEWASEQDTPVRDIPAGESHLIYRQLWESINGRGSWDTNPWVWVVKFKRIDLPEAQTRDNESVFMALQLVGGTEAITEDIVESWSDIEARDAQQWALSAHINASDHEDVTVLPIPSCVRRHMKGGDKNEVDHGRATK